MITFCNYNNVLNYNSEATADDGSCQYPTVTDFSYKLIIDAIEDDGSWNISDCSGLVALII